MSDSDEFPDELREDLNYVSGAYGDDDDEDEDEDGDVIVIELGSDSVKVGWAGDEAPKHEVSHEEADPDYPPVERGRASGGYSLETTVKKALDGMGFDPAGKIGLGYVVVSRPDQKVCFDSLRQFLFDNCNAATVYIQCALTAGLAGSGRSTGVVIDQGRDYTTIVPVYEGYGLPPSTTEGIYWDPDDGNILARTPAQVAKQLCQSVSKIPEDGRAEILDTIYIMGSNSDDLNGDTLKECLGSTEWDMKVQGTGTVLHECNGADIVGLIKHVVIADDRRLAAWIGSSIIASMSTFVVNMEGCTKGTDLNPEAPIIIF